ncbi:MAG: cation transporter, partial [Alphaproteobacteria bacterium]
MTNQPEITNLAITGMTCAACSARLERVVAKVPGVLGVQVNLATETARIETEPAAVPLETLVDTVVRAGFGATRVAVELPSAAVLDRHEAEVAEQSRQDFRTFVLAAALSAPLVIQMVLDVMGLHVMLHPVTQLLLATPVQFWAGARFYTGAVRSLRGGAGNMEVLVALGTSAAYGLSAYRV